MRTDGKACAIYYISDTLPHVQVVDFSELMKRVVQYIIFLTECAFSFLNRQVSQNQYLVKNQSLLLLALAL